MTIYLITMEPGARKLKVRPSRSVSVYGMNVFRIVVCLLWYLLSAGPSLSAVAQRGGVSQAALAEMITSTQLGEQKNALAAIDRLGKDDVDLKLRAALLEALKRETLAHVARYKAGQLARSLPELEDPVFIGALVRSVARLGDARSIPVLAPTTAFGFEAIHALAAFGELAAGEVLNVVEDRDGMYYAVEGGLVTLRFMIEAPRAGVLSVGTMQRIRRVVRDRLTGHAGNVEFIVLWAAIDLAVVLGDSELRALVQVLADDQKEIANRGITHSEVADRTQRRAIDGLAGIPPMPRPPVMK